MTPTPEIFREVLGHVPTGVMVVTGYDRIEPVGMACNSFTSVSLEPPLVSFCPAATSKTWPRIRASGHFCINVVASHRAELSRIFSAGVGDRFKDVDWHSRPGGPGLDGAVAWISCEVRDEHVAGDHLIVVGEVVDLEVGDPAEPLVFWRGRYGSFSPGFSD